MTNVEFLMNSVGINISKMNEDEKRFIKYEVIPMFNMLPDLKSSKWDEELQKPWIVVNNETGEERTLNNPEEILKELKELVKDYNEYYEIPEMNDVEFVLTSYNLFNKRNRLTKRGKSKIKKEIIPSLEEELQLGDETTTMTHNYFSERRELNLVELLDELRKIANDDKDYILSNPDFNQRGKMDSCCRMDKKMKLVPYYDCITSFIDDLYFSEEN